MNTKLRRKLISSNRLTLIPEVIIFNGLCSGSIFGACLLIRLLPLLESLVLEKLFSLSPLSRTSWIIIPPLMYSILTLRIALLGSLLDSRGLIQLDLVVINVVTIEEFRTKALKAVDKYLQMPIEDRKPCMFVLDSLGMLSTEKEITDALDDKQVRDMTKSQLVKGAFRMLTLKLGQANVPLIVTNHTYDVIGAYVPTKEMGGGSGLKYAASTIIYLSKKKEKDGKEVIGNIIKAKTHKSRLSKENKQVEIRLYYDDRGLDRYYGLLEVLGEIGGLWKNVAGRYEINWAKSYMPSRYSLNNPT